MLGFRLGDIARSALHCAVFCAKLSSSFFENRNCAIP